MRFAGLAVNASPGQAGTTPSASVSFTTHAFNYKDSQSGAGAALGSTEDSLGGSAMGFVS